MAINIRQEMKKLNRRCVFYTYIVECRDGTYYAGYTNDLEKRLREHNDSKRGARYTRGRRPVRLVWCREYRYFKSAHKTERIIKQLTRRQKESLVNGRRLDKVLMEARALKA